MAFVEYELHTVVRDDINEGWIWVRDAGLEGRLEGRRRIVKVSYIGEDGPPKKAKCIYCEALYASDVDIRRFNEYFDPKIEAEKIKTKQYRLIFISAWYRRLLDIPEKLLRCKINVEITISNSPLGYCRACFQHPQVVALLATVLAFIGVGLGFIGLGLGLIGIKDWWPAGRSVGIVFVLLGVIGSVVSLLPLVKRARQPNSDVARSQS